MDEPAAAATREPVPPRPDVLGYPSPTTSRFLIFTAALLASGLFVGNYVHTWLLGEAWMATVSRCMETWGAGGTVTEMLEDNRGFVDCTAGVERERVMVTVAGAVLAGAAAVAMLWVAPVLVRRRRRLADLPDGLSGAAGRFSELAAEAGVSHRVTPVIGAAAQRDAFSFGAPGRYQVALPPAAAVRWRDATFFDPLVRHELAHVAHRDVALAWLAKLVWFALAPLLALPVVVGLLTGDLSLLPGYSWRVLLLVAAVALVSSALLRSREHGADLGAARPPAGPEQILGLVRRITPAPERSLRDRLLAKHPTPRERAAVIEEPGVLTRVSFVEGVTGAFLASLAVPLVVSSVTPLLAQVERAHLSYALAAAVLGPMLAGSVGLGIWRAALFARLTGTDVRTMPVAAGVALGLVLGQAVSLQQSGLGSVSGVVRPGWLPVSALAGAGAVIVASGLGHLWADAAPRLPGMRTAWLLALGVNSVVFSTVLWATTLFQTTVDELGWPWAGLVLMSTLAPWTTFWLALLLAGVALTAMLLTPRREAATPSWLLEDGTGAPSSTPWQPPQRIPLWHTVALGLAAGVAGASAIAVFRWASGLSGSDEETYVRFLSYQWVAGAAGGVAAAITTTSSRRHGGGAAPVAAAVAAFTVLAGFLVLNAALGGTNTREVVTDFVRPAVVLGLYATLLVVPVVALVRALRPLPRRPLRPGRRTVAVTVPVALLLGTGSAAGVLQARTDLVGTPALHATLLDVAEPTAQAPVAEASAYVTEVVPVITGTYTSVAVTARQILQDPALDGPAQARLLSSEVLPPLTALLEQVEQVVADDPRVARVHSEAVAALRLAVEQYEWLVASGGFPSTADLAAVQQLGVEENARWQAWVEGVESLETGAGRA